LGILPENVVAVATTIAKLPGLLLEGVFMHFADAADEAYSREQITRFETALAALTEAGISIPLRHAASSAAAVLYPQARYDLIRPGAGIYGFHSPEWLHDSLPLIPALSWKCLVIQVKDYPPGSSLGYNRTFTTRRPTRIAVLPVGYADGYLRSFSNHTAVLIHGAKAPVVGQISMDYTMVDVTDLPAVEIGTEATLIGSNGDRRITLEDLARRAETIPYTIACGLGRRPGRIYVDRPE
jgi:alanine racemase